MMPEQRDLLLHARDSVAAAKLLANDPLHAGFAASRAYYGMFYCAQALLLGKEMSFKKHSAVIGAFGREFAKPNLVPQELHSMFISAEDRRLSGDYDARNTVTPDEAAETIRDAETFIAATEIYLSNQP